MFQKNKKIIISEDEPLVVGKLKVYPNRFQYKDIRCNFVDVEHIGWYWLSQTINLINTQDVRLTLYIRGRQKPIHIKKTAMYVTPKLVAAYNFIAKKTFDNRMQHYLSQLSESGGFYYSGASIYTDGRVQYEDNTFSLSKAEFEPFRITIKKGGVFSAKAKLDLNLDRDVILALIDYIIQNPQDPASFASGHQHGMNGGQRAPVLDNLIALMANLSKADGHVSPEEINIVKSFLTNEIKLDQQQFSELITVFNNTKSASTIFAYHAAQIYSEFSDNQGMLESILELLFSIAIADGVLSAEEELLLLEAEAIFGIQGRQYRQYRSEQHEAESKEVYYLNILGLSSGASLEQIRKEYKRLVMKYHPDRVHHLGEDFVKEADRKMKEINAAYNYLCS